MTSEPSSENNNNNPSQPTCLVALILSSKIVALAFHRMMMTIRFKFAEFRGASEASFVPKHRPCNETTCPSLVLSTLTGEPSLPLHAAQNSISRARSNSIQTGGPARRSPRAKPSFCSLLVRCQIRGRQIDPSELAWPGRRALQFHGQTGATAAGFVCFESPCVDRCASSHLFMINIARAWQPWL